MVNQDKTEAIRAAVELGYVKQDSTILERIRNAKTLGEINRIMRGCRLS